MKGYHARILKSYPVIAALAVITRFASAETNSFATPDLAAEEKDACARNLTQIYQAIQAFQNDHHDLPNWLSDLVPAYIADTNILLCPVCARTGNTEIRPLADPKIATCYLFEFCPVPLGNTAPKAPARTRREWKRKQMGLVGSMVPIVRCRQHQPVLNLAFDGRIYDSPSSWESLVTNRVSFAELTAARLFANEPANSGTAVPAGNNRSSSPPPATYISARDAQATKELLDLTPFYNASFTNSWHGNAGNDLAAFPAGLVMLNGVQFDARGIVQLGSKSPTAGKFPARVKDIELHQKCGQLYFLHAAGFGSINDEGKQVGSFVVHYATNQMSVEIPIIYGRDVRNWHDLANEPPSPSELKVAWTGQNAVSRRAGRFLRLFITTWTNPAPELEIQSLEYVSSMTQPAPFLLAITAAAPPPPSVPPLAGSRTQAAALPLSKTTLLLLISPPAIFLLTLALWLRARRRQTAAIAQTMLPVSAADSSRSLVYLPNMTPALSQTSSVSIPGGELPEDMTPGDDEMWRRRALDAEERARRAAAIAQQELAPGLSQWLKTKLVGKLVSDRAALLQAQEAAASKVLAVDERLSRVERQVQEQNQNYQRRIEELTRELLAAKDENRELIRVQIAQVKAEMEAARARLLAEATE